MVVFFPHVSTSSTSILQHKLCRDGVCSRLRSNVNNDNSFIYCRSESNLVKMAVFYPMFQHRALQFFSINSVEMDLTGIIQKFSTPLERKQDDGVFSRVSTSSASILQHKLCRDAFNLHYTKFLDSART